LNIIKDIEEESEIEEAEDLGEEESKTSPAPA
jgi:hypothetical protein